MRPFQSKVVRWCMILSINSSIDPSMAYSFYKAPKAFVVEAYLKNHMCKERVEGGTIYIVRR